jgi:hypothetical protein
MHTNILKLAYIHNNVLHVLANHVASFRDVKYKGSIHYEVENKITFFNFTSLKMATWLAKTCKSSLCI